MLPTDVAIIRAADINEKTGVSLLVSETDVMSVDLDLLCSGDGGIPHHASRCRPSPQAYQVDAVPYTLHWNLKMPTHVPVDDSSCLIVSISVVCLCHNSTDHA